VDSNSEPPTTKAMAFCSNGLCNTDFVWADGELSFAALANVNGAKETEPCVVMIVP
jgi:hypothetical protein